MDEQLESKEQNKTKLTISPLGPASPLNPGIPRSPYTKMIIRYADKQKWEKKETEGKQIFLLLTTEIKSYISSENREWTINWEHTDVPLGPRGPVAPWGPGGPRGPGKPGAPAIPWAPYRYRRKGETCYDILSFNSLSNWMWFSSGISFNIQVYSNIWPLISG